MRSFFYFLSNVVLQVKKKQKMNPNQESEAEDDLPQQNVPYHQLQALMGQMERMLTRALQLIQEKLDEVDARTRNRQPLNVQNRRRVDVLFRRMVRRKMNWKSWRNHQLIGAGLGMEMRIEGMQMGIEKLGIGKTITWVVLR